MVKVTNLNRFRKARARADKARHAEENRIRFGRTRAEKLLAKTEKSNDRAHLDGHKLDKDDD